MNGRTETTLKAMIVGKVNAGDEMQEGEKRGGRGKSQDKKWFHGELTDWIDWRGPWGALARNNRTTGYCGIA